MRLGSCELGNHICGDVQLASPTEHRVLTQETEVAQGQTKGMGAISEARERQMTRVVSLETWEE